MTITDTILAKDVEGNTYDVVYSPDDGGWYAEKYSPNGAIVDGFESEIYRTADIALAHLKLQRI